MQVEVWEISLNRTRPLFLVESARHSIIGIHTCHTKQPQLLPAKCHLQMTVSPPAPALQSTFPGGGVAGHG